MARQLKQYLRRRKAKMLACDCECLALKCRRENTCDCTDKGDSSTFEPLSVNPIIKPSIIHTPTAIIDNEEVINEVENVEENVEGEEEYVEPEIPEEVLENPAEESLSELNS